MGEARAQISVEYLIIIAVALGILIPGILFFYSYTKSGEATATNTQINDIGLRMISTVKSTYALGNGAWQTIEVTIPDTVTRIYVNQTELVFIYDTPSGSSEAVFFSNINMTGAMSDGNITLAHPGVTQFRFTSQGRIILINETI
jgi:hypothetical protein